MNQKWIVGLLFLWLIGQFTCLIIEGVYFGEEEVSVMNALLGFVVNVSSENNLFVNIVNVLAGIGGFFWGLVRVLLWDYSFLNSGVGEMIKWFLLIPFSAGTVFGIYAMFRR